MEDLDSVMENQKDELELHLGGEVLGVSYKSRVSEGHRMLTVAK